MTSTSHLIPAHGGELVQLIASPERSAELKAHSREWLSWDLTARQVCDLELLLSGGFSPLRGFMKRADYERVCHNMHLTSGVLWPMPITLDVTEEFAKKLQPGTSKIALRDAEGVDRKSTRLNSSHQIISYAVFCLKKKKKKQTI